MFTAFNVAKPLRLSIRDRVFETYRWSFSFSGPIDPMSGMIINLIEVEKIIEMLSREWQDHHTMEIWHRRLELFESVEKFLVGELGNVKFNGLSLVDSRKRQVWNLSRDSSEIIFSANVYFKDEDKTQFIPLTWTWSIPFASGTGGATGDTNKQSKPDPTELSEYVFPAMEGLVWDSKKIGHFLGQGSTKSVQIGTGEVSRIFFA